MRISRYHYKHNQAKSAFQFRANDFIRIPQVRVIDENGEHLGVMTTAEAKAKAAERGFDLVEVNPSAQPPVVKFLDYGQFKYEKEKELKKQKQALKQIEVKGVRISNRIGAHDLEIRRAQTLKFLTEGNKVKVEIILRGRERQHAQLAIQTIREFIQSLRAQMGVKIEQSTTAQGGKISTLIAKE